MTDKPTKPAHPLGEMETFDSLDPRYAEMGAHPQPDVQDVYIQEMWAREHAKNVQQALSRRRRRFWRKVAAVAVAVALTAGYLMLVVWL